MSPAHNLEFFLAAPYESVREHGGGRPHPQDAAFLITRYRSEFGMLAIPALVQREVITMA